MNENKEKQEDTIKGNKEEKKYKIVYSTYGYLQISEEDLKNNLLTKNAETLKISKELLSDHNIQSMSKFNSIKEFRIFSISLKIN